MTGRSGRSGKGLLNLGLSTQSVSHHGSMIHSGAQYKVPGIQQESWVDAMQMLGTMFVRSRLSHSIINLQRSNT